MKRNQAYLSSALLLSAAALYATPAAACGGMFVPPTETTVVSGHRMALSIATTQTVLWDQIQYSGDPAGFSWVLPVKPGTVVEAANSAFFEALEAGSATEVQAPNEGCGGTGSGIGCGSAERAAMNDFAGAGFAAAVKVVHQGAVGPYETVTLSSKDPNALADWLVSNGYSLPEDMKPTVKAYVDEGFDFIALKLKPGNGVKQMTPVRVVTPGAGYTLPLRMVAAGSGEKVGIVLYVISEGRYQAANFDNVVIPPALVSWDFKEARSDYADVRASVLGNSDGRTWLTSYSLRGSLLGEVPLRAGFAVPVSFRVGDNEVESAFTIADAYFRRAGANAEIGVSSCVGKLEAFSDSMNVVTDVCDENGDNCGVAGAGQIDARLLTCQDFDDIAVALTGMHPKDVVLTRMEASLPRQALSTDLLLEAASEQREVQSRFVAGLRLNACLDSEPAALLTGENRPGLPPGGWVMLVFGAAGLMLVVRRERRGRATTA